jgi:threonine dehydrogenase-like Zn-dependent dehydrogenase
VINPSTEEIVGVVPVASPEEIDLAMQLRVQQAELARLNNEMSTEVNPQKRMLLQYEINAKQEIYALENKYRDITVEIINLKKQADPLARLQAEVGEAGYDAAILAVGSAQAVRDGLATLRPKGRFVVFSALPGETPVDLFHVHLREPGQEHKETIATGAAAAAAGECAC